MPAGRYKPRPAVSYWYQERIGPWPGRGNAMKNKTVGIIGGVGPMATVYFMELVIQMTEAARDQDHIDMIVLNHATIPDRTSFILGGSAEDPLPVMIEDAKKLEQAGADFVVIPCNTAHYFFREIQNSIRIPMLNIVEETVSYAKETVPGLKKLGILATSGTIGSKTYQLACQGQGIACVTPDKAGQEAVMRIIYDQVKAGREVDIAAFYYLVESLKERGCQAVVLGCTELSVVRRDFHIRQREIIDSLEVLARQTVLGCGKRLKKPETEQAPAKAFTVSLNG